MENELTDFQVSAIIKAALEYNSEIIVLATNYYGNMSNMKNIKSFRKEYKRTGDIYRKTLDRIIGVDNA